MEGKTETWLLCENPLLQSCESSNEKEFDIFVTARSHDLSADAPEQVKDGQVSVGRQG